MRTGGESDDPLRNAPIGETATITESKTFHSANYAPDIFYESDRIGDHRIADVEVVETDDGYEAFRVTWEGDMTKTLPRRWDYHAEPVTTEEKRQERRNKWLRRAGRAAAFIIPFAAIAFVSTTIMNEMAGSMTINGEPMATSTPYELVPAIAILFIFAAFIYYGIQGLPRGTPRR